MKRKVVNTERLSKMVKNHILGDGGLIPEQRINTIIKEYLSERDEFLDDDTPIEDKYEFSPTTNKAFDDMLGGVEEMIGDLEVIKEKDSDVVVEVDLYADEYISNMISSLEAVSEDLKFLKGLSSNIEDEEWPEEPIE
jgi:hypothetical protein